MVLLSFLPIANPKSLITLWWCSEILPEVSFVLLPVEQSFIPTPLSSPHQEMLTSLCHYSVYMYNYSFIWVIILFIYMTPDAYVEGAQCSSQLQLSLVIWIEKRAQNHFHVNRSACSVLNLAMENNVGTERSFSYFWTSINSLNTELWKKTFELLLLSLLTTWQNNISSLVRASEQHPISCSNLSCHLLMK